MWFKSKPKQIKVYTKDLSRSYDSLIKEFNKLMVKEFGDNSKKGDRQTWINMTEDEVLLELYYHVAKLQKAVHNKEENKIREHIGDTANLCLILSDIKGYLKEEKQLYDELPEGDSTTWGRTDNLGKYKYSQPNWYYS